jgi:hypothetical protein
MRDGLHPPAFPLRSGQSPLRNVYYHYDPSESTSGVGSAIIEAALHVVLEGNDAGIRARGRQHERGDEEQEEGATVVEEQATMTDGAAVRDAEDNTHKET